MVALNHLTGRPPMSDVTRILSQIHALEQSWTLHSSRSSDEAASVYVFGQSAGLGHNPPPREYHEVGYQGPSAGLFVDFFSGVSRPFLRRLRD